MRPTMRQSREIPDVTFHVGIFGKYSLLIVTIVPTRPLALPIASVKSIRKNKMENICNSVKEFTEN